MAIEHISDMVSQGAKASAQHHDMSTGSAYVAIAEELVLSLQSMKYRRKIMNLTKFLKLVDKEIEKMTIEEIEKFLHEYARTLPENQREKFLHQLKEVQQQAESKRNMQNRTDKEKAEIEKEISVLKKTIKID